MSLLQAPVAPFLCNGSDDTIDSLTMTSDAPYPVEFIQIGGDGNQLLNCQIYGPVQPGDSSTWVVNRGFVTQGNAINLPVRNNGFHMLRQPAYLNPGSAGTIMDNVAYNTGGYVVDWATFLFSGNSCGLPANAVDIALLSRRRSDRFTIRFSRCRAATAVPRSAIKARPTAKLAADKHLPSDGSKAGTDLAPAQTVKKPFRDVRRAAALRAVFRIPDSFSKSSIWRRNPARARDRLPASSGRPASLTSAVDSEALRGKVSLRVSPAALQA